MMKVAVWADYTWCELEEIGEFAHMSDDFMIVDVPEEEEDVDEFLMKTKPQG